MQDKYQNDSMLQYSKESHEIKLSTEVGVATKKYASLLEKELKKFQENVQSTYRAK